MVYITVKETAVKWHIAERSVQNYCANEKIPNAKRVGGQWLIPLDAKLPLDGRTKIAKKNKSKAHYKFPVFIYSRYYRDFAELNQDEQCLLKAQLLHFEGNHMQSIILCNNLLKSKIPAYLQAGVYLILGIDAFLLGLITQYEEAVIRLERLTDREKDNIEDFRLMTAALKFFINWDSSSILNINSSKLSSEAIWFYQTLNLSVSAISSTAIPAYYVKFLESECLFFEKENMIPMLYYFLVGLGILNDCERTQEEKDILLNKGVKLAIKHNWITNLHRFYNFAPDILSSCVKSCGDSYYQKLIKAHQISLHNWNIVHLKETGSNLTDNFTPKQFELLLLISYGYTNKEISLCTGIAENSIRKKCKELMTISKTSNKSQLRAYAQAFFNSSK